ncbi:type IX secretion system membrane protein PorP/SprF [Flavobacterium sp. ACN6]|uniref:PorP/SprF family type IX secretion system membrane protein n=1 Tax=Flavobacterium sp. ACN6 TaxID=1920426 RepID=UPI000BB3081A|nr:type IX secretion system membrane protein PorP/SprF [Flavobacterium sp. ACN6]
MKVRLIILTILLYTTTWAQQDPQFTQYMYNTMSINPAYAGSRGVISIFGMHRTQWIGVDGAPTTNNFSLHSPIGDRGLGLGVTIGNDQIGPSLENDIAANISYTINLGDDYKFAFGLKGSASLLSVDFTKLNIYDPSDPRFQYNIDNKFVPNIGAGLYLYKDNAYVGLSVPSMLEVSHYDKGASDEGNNFMVTEHMHYYLMAGYVMDLDYNLKFKPSLLMKMTPGAPLQVDVSANFLYNEKFTAGLAYRWSGALSAMAGFQVSDSFAVGYAYDAETNKLASYNSGSHEIFLRFEIFKSSSSRMMSPRFF